jgi:hypothetical protein
MRALSLGIARLVPIHGNKPSFGDKKICNSFGLRWKQKGRFLHGDAFVFIRRASDAQDKKSPESL